MHVMRTFLQKLGVVALHISIAWLAVFICLAYIVPLIKVPELVAFVIVCFSFPVMGFGMLFLAGTTLTLAVLLS